MNLPELVERDIRDDVDPVGTHRKRILNLLGELRVLAQEQVAKLLYRLGNVLDVLFRRRLLEIVEHGLRRFAHAEATAGKARESSP